MNTTLSLLFHARKAAGSLYVYGLRVDGASTQIVMVKDRDKGTTTSRLAAYSGVVTMESYLTEEPVAELALPECRDEVKAWIQEWM